MIHEIIINYIPWIIGIVGALVFFKLFTKFNIEKYKEQQKTKKEQIKQQGDILDQDIQQYIKNPEEAIRVLMADRKVKEREHNTKGIDIIDNQIKMLEVLAQIPAPIRPYAAKIGQMGMRKLTNMVESFGR